MYSMFFVQIYDIYIKYPNASSIYSSFFHPTPQKKRPHMLCFVKKKLSLHIRYHKVEKMEK